MSLLVPQKPSLKGSRGLAATRRQPLRSPPCATEGHPRLRISITALPGEPTEAVRGGGVTHTYTFWLRGIGITLRSSGIACPRVAGSSICRLIPHPKDARRWHGQQTGRPCCLSCRDLGICPQAGMQKNEQRAKMEGAELCPSLKVGSGHG